MTRNSPPPTGSEIGVLASQEAISVGLQIKAIAFYISARSCRDERWYSGAIIDQLDAARVSLADRVLRGVEP